ncbi:DUF3054 domain-containing protein [Williamsia sterculiae]|uniref:DUF3054 domain-containing protein n=1 Tax=Williamsia sterculiae TaxID=1344003 RepID=A0A1N7CCG3_9NOCA|nr:DUF3054 domain-containing protein [Williamsia sterculiae]SIR61295.1 Protein of unknown function [Williamsia sterculiae]
MNGRSAATTVVAAGCDVLAILVFVIIGRFNHHDGLRPTGILSTFWPFALGAVLGWSLCYVVAQVRSSDLLHHDFRPESIWVDGMVIWVATVAIGMVLRQQFGQGIAISFVIVATIVLGLFLLGWRGARMAMLRRRLSGA